MKKRPLSLVFLLSLCICLSCLMPLLHDDTTTVSFLPQASSLGVQGDGSDPSDPYPLLLDTYYGDPWDDYFETEGDVRYLKFDVQANEIYYIYYKPEIWWDVELYDDPDYSILLGPSYSVPEGGFMDEYLIFSPTRTGTYYAIFYQQNEFAGVTLAILTAEDYTINTTELVIIGVSKPTRIFQVDLEAGNYTSTYDALYVSVERGWNYVVLPDAYETFPEGPLFSLGNLSVAIIIEESCEFCLTYYPPQNETPPDDPPDDPPNNSTNPEDSLVGIFDGLTPAFGVGILIGVCVLYKVKKK